MTTKRKSKNPAVPTAKEAPVPARLAAIRAAAARLPQRPPALDAYFLLVSRSEPKGRRFLRLRARSVLAWFQRVWNTSAATWQGELGGHVYGLSKLFDTIAELKLPPPATGDQLRRLLEKHLAYKRNFEAEEHFVHVETDDDEVAINYYFFDEELLRTPEAFERLPSSDTGRSQVWSEEPADDAYAILIRERFP